MNINSKSDCEMLIDRIHRTLQAQKPSVIKRIQKQPSKFHGDDRYIFGGLCRAIFSIQAVYSDIERNLAEIKSSLFDYDIVKVANLSDAGITGLYERKFKPLKIKARFLKKELIWIRDDAKKFQNIQQEHDSVWKFIKQCIKDNGQDSLMECFIKTRGQFKLNGVRLPVCCEFFNNVGIDEFKPDEHATRFFKRIGVAKSDRPKEIRMAGITIAETLGKPRKYVDSYIWNFCAEGRGEICTKDNPKCHLCRLKIEKPVLCRG